MTNRSHATIAHSALLALIANAADELHDRNLDALSAALDFNELTATIIHFHDAFYSTMTPLPDLDMTDDELDDFEPEALESEETPCCERALALIDTIFYSTYND